MIKWFKNIGPGALIAAAFIGPGTVTVCTLAGAQYGFALLWTMVFSIFATILLQEMSARLGLVSKMGLAKAVRNEITNPTLRWMAIILIMAAILVGNAAYEAGNISGGVMGLSTIIKDATFSIGNSNINILSLLIGIIAFMLLYLGNYKIIEKVLVFLVILMSLAFLLTAIMTNPDLAGVLKGLLIPSFPDGSLLMTIALVGTTVVPYNLFLHASLVQEKWSDKSVSLTVTVQKARKDTIASITLGGIVSIAIIICATAIQSTEVSGAADLAKGLEPLLGNSAKYFMAMGLFAAGITSAITAPLAAAYVAQGCFDWERNLKSLKFRVVWMVILILGVFFSATGIKPIEIIKFAQVANGLLLPIIAGFLLWVMNRSSLLGNFKNTRFQNVLGWLIVLVTMVLGLKSIAKVFNLF